MQAWPRYKSLAVRRRRSSIAAVLALAATAAPTRASAADDEPSAVPYRPSVSTPATLSAPGWIEVEGGLQHLRDEDSRRDSVPVTLKLALTPDWGIRVGGDAWARVRDDTGGSVSGLGDLGVVLKRRFAVDDASAFGLEAGALFPTGRPGSGPGSGKTDYGLNAIYSADFAGSWHTDLNLMSNRIGQIDAGTGRAQWLGAASLSKSLDDQWSVVGELSGAHRQGVADSSQLLLAASYSVSKRLVIDAGAARSLRAGTPTWSAFTGFTWLAARVF
jgi:hypothetical protein